MGPSLFYKKLNVIRNIRSETSRWGPGTRLVLKALVASLANFSDTKTNS